VVGIPCRTQDLTWHRAARQRQSAAGFLKDIWPRRRSGRHVRSAVTTAMYQKSTVRFSGDKRCRDSSPEGNLYAGKPTPPTSSSRPFLKYAQTPGPHDIKGARVLRSGHSVTPTIFRRRLHQPTARRQISDSKGVKPRVQFLWCARVITSDDARTFANIACATCWSGMKAADLHQRRRKLTIYDAP